MIEDSLVHPPKEDDRRLAVRRREILAMPPEKALDALLEHRHPGALIRSFPEEDLFLLIQDIGVEDALEILGLAGYRQWEYILDLEAWKKDRLSTGLLTRWLFLLLQANPRRLVRWVLEEKTSLIEFYLYKSLDVVIREHDQDPSELGEGFFTLDDTFYYRFREDVEHSRTEDRELRDAVLQNILERVADFDFIEYQKMMLEIPRFIPAEHEEEAYRRRNIRLAEKGFLPFEEALGIYQPLSPRDLKGGGIKRFVRAEAADRDGEPLPVPQSPLEGLTGESIFARTLGSITEPEVLVQLQQEFAGLSNQIIAADAGTVKSRDQLKTVVRKAAGYLSIGLEILTRKKGKQAHGYRAALVERVPLKRLFRVGYGSAVRLKWKAERWRRTCWFERAGLPLAFWDEAGMGTIGGLLVDRPLFFDDHETGTLYREFATYDDLLRTKRILEEVIWFDDLFSKMDIGPVRTDDPFLTFKSVLLTLWARYELGLPGDLSPIFGNRFERFFDHLWEGDAAGSRKIGRAPRRSLLSFLADAGGTSVEKVSGRVGGVVEAIFLELEEEYGAVPAAHLNPRYIRHFWVAAAQDDGSAFTPSGRR